MHKLLAVNILVKLENPWCANFKTICQSYDNIFHSIYFDISSQGIQIRAMSLEVFSFEKVTQSSESCKKLTRDFYLRLAPNFV